MERRFMLQPPDLRVRATWAQALLGISLFIGREPVDENSRPSGPLPGGRSVMPVSDAPSRWAIAHVGRPRLLGTLAQAVRRSRRSPNGAMRNCRTRPSAASSRSMHRQRICRTGFAGRRRRGDYPLANRFEELDTPCSTRSSSPGKGFCSIDTPAARSSYVPQSTAIRRLTACAVRAASSAKRVSGARIFRLPSSAPLR
jgi:hypothetical protein